MTLSWSAPAGSNVAEWKLHCYNSDGFDQVLTTDATSAVIEGIDTAAPYTVEISASGMSMTTRTDIPANAVTVANFESLTVHCADKASFLLSPSPAPPDL